MGEIADAETVFELMRSYFDTARAALERHGGTVEKFIGDAVVGDVRGARGARGRRAARLPRRARDPGADVAASTSAIAVRIGVNTGEVVAGDAARREMFASGDAVVLGDSVNVAARLEQAAQPGEVLIGEETYRLVRDAVAVEPVAPIAAKGKAEPLTAFRLLEASAHGPLPRRAGTPLVGRGEELARLEAEFDGVGAGLPAGHRRRRGRGRQVAAHRGAGRANRRPRPDRARRLPLLRRGDHLLGDRADRPRAGRDPRRRHCRAGARARARRGSRSCSGSRRGR